MKSTHMRALTRRISGLTLIEVKINCRHCCDSRGDRLPELSGADEKRPSRRDAVVHDGSGAARSTVSARCPLVCVHRGSAWLPGDACRSRAVLHHRYRSASPRIAANVHHHRDANRFTGRGRRPDDR
jgi:hypothetical protein